MADLITMVFRPRSGHLGSVWEAAVASAVGQFCLIFRLRLAALNLVRSVLVILIVVTVVVCQVRRKKRRLRAVEEESVARAPKKRKEKVTPKDLEMGEAGVADDDLDVELVTDEEEIDKPKVSFNLLLLPLVIC